ncbi:hypothetical protein EZV62_026024 [Acer yangbiense]|uniref:PH domain-containing protein n=1 Tax=Acer yangbiense TaxID=1000413 RepID=A0A5C7H029_9ROSI|nr:hypothetical protein EZV62_026024 [Acer yangbiense]
MDSSPVKQEKSEKTKNNNATCDVSPIGIRERNSLKFLSNYLCQVGNIASTWQRKLERNFNEFCENQKPKPGQYIKTWRRRWFVLKQGKLLWFKESTVMRATRTRGVIPVASCLTVKGAEDVLNKQYAFEMSLRTETMYFIADSEKEKEDWIYSIARSIV